MGPPRTSSILVGPMLPHNATNAKPYFEFAMSHCVLSNYYKIKIMHGQNSVDLDHIGLEDYLVDAIEMY
jgi:hypothetical protein